MYQLLPLRDVEILIEELGFVKRPIFGPVAPKEKRAFQPFVSLRGKNDCLT